jgi:hypothetical protein
MCGGTSTVAVTPSVTLLVLSSPVLSVQLKVPLADRVALPPIPEIS